MELKEYLKNPGSCIFCGSNYIIKKSDKPQFRKKSLIIECKCTRCGKTWEDVYGYVTTKSTCSSPIMEVGTIYWLDETYRNKLKVKLLSSGNVFCRVVAADDPTGSWEVMCNRLSPYTSDIDSVYVDNCTQFRELLVHLGLDDKGVDTIMLKAQDYKHLFNSERVSPKEMLYAILNEVQIPEKRTMWKELVDKLMTKEESPK